MVKSAASLCKEENRVENLGRLPLDRLYEGLASLRVASALILCNLLENAGI
jgi:hypothetical protein